MFKLLTIVPRLQAFVVPDDDLEGRALMRDKFNIKYFSVNGVPYLEHSGNKVIPNESVAIIQNIDGIHRVTKIFNNIDECLKVYNVTNIDIT